MRTLLLIIALLSSSAQAPAPRTPVLVELFTSEGCSSCPPADALLSRLSHEQPVAGAEIVPLELHVTYWDDLGWKDPASLRDATGRQEAYARHFGTDNIYTPQAVIDGRAQAVGSDRDAIQKAIAKAALQAHLQLSISAVRDGAAVNVSVSAPGGPAGTKGPLDAIVALTEDGITSAVRRGENGGRTLRHDALVRALVVTAANGTTATARIALQPGWQPERLRAVAALQERASGRIVATAISTLR